MRFTSCEAMECSGRLKGGGGPSLQDNAVDRGGAVAMWPSTGTLRPMGRQAASDGGGRRTFIVNWCPTPLEPLVKMG